MSRFPHQVKSGTLHYKSCRHCHLLQRDQEQKWSPSCLACGFLWNVRGMETCTADSWWCCEDFCHLRPASNVPEKRKSAPSSAFPQDACAHEGDSLIVYKSLVACMSYNTVMRLLVFSFQGHIDSHVYQQCHEYICRLCHLLGYWLHGKWAQSEYRSCGRPR